MLEASSVAAPREVQVRCLFTPTSGCLARPGNRGREEACGVRMGIAKSNGGAYGLGVIYAKTMFNGHEG